MSAKERECVVLYRQKRERKILRRVQMCACCRFFVVRSFAYEKEKEEDALSLDFAEGIAQAKKLISQKSTQCTMSQKSESRDTHFFFLMYTYYRADI
mmetsp:Transcript_25005/g.40351  ORF Transcript_25005/g.40351 Transcript_25005/m.40351 type:complete len:97 (-) Transcript_25005:50-340(-)